MINIAILITALVAVESGGRANCIGDGGQALGCLQIHKGVIDDVNRIQNSVHFIHADAFKPEVAKAICTIYLKHYATAERLGHEPTYEDMARIWNGGPTGHTKPATVPYWRRVEAELHKLTVPLSTSD